MSTFKLLALGLVAASATAAMAGPIRRTYISDMSANPDAGSVTANMHHTVASHVALVAVNDPIDIRKVTLHMANGRSYVVPHAVRLRPNEQGVIALPCRESCAIDAISLEYDRRDQRVGARTKIYTLDETDAPRRERDPAYDEGRPYDSYPSERTYR